MAGDGGLCRCGRVLWPAVAFHSRVRLGIEWGRSGPVTESRLNTTVELAAGTEAGCGGPASESVVAVQQSAPRGQRELDVHLEI